MTRMPGADTLVPVTDAIIAIVKQRFGEMPLFWGRYFKRPGFEEDYQPQIENRVFAANNIRLLPIARQTNRVAGTASMGAEDAILNVDAFTSALGIRHLSKIGGAMLMFLDVEGTSDRNPNLSLDYWIGWSSALRGYSRRVSDGRFVVAPAVYCRQNQNPTWEVIARADERGLPCCGAWVFRMRRNACTKPIPAWDAPFNTPAVALPCPIMIWQFAIDCLNEAGVDLNMLNPDPGVAAALLNRLVLPPI